MPSRSRLTIVLGANKDKEEELKSFVQKHLYQLRQYQIIMVQNVETLQEFNLKVEVYKSSSEGLSSKLEEIIIQEKVVAIIFLTERQDLSRLGANHNILYGYDIPTGTNVLEGLYRNP